MQIKPRKSYRGFFCNSLDSHYSNCTEIIGLVYMGNLGVEVGTQLCEEGQNRCQDGFVRWAVNLIAFTLFYQNLFPELIYRILPMCYLSKLLTPANYKTWDALPIQFSKQTNRAANIFFVCIIVAWLTLVSQSSLLDSIGL